MYEYIFSGKIHPERVNFSINEKIIALVEHKEFGVDDRATISFENSIITISLESYKNYGKDTKCNLETIKNIIEQYVRQIVDTYCYVRSFSYDVEVSKVVCSSLGIDYIFGVQGEWNISKKNEEANTEFSKILKLFQSPEKGYLKYVFADFRRAIKYNEMTASFCFRAIETIRIFYFEDRNILNFDKRRELGWKKLGQVLGFKEAHFVEIKKFALPNRHGEYPVITYEERERIMNFTRNLIDRFIDIVTTVL